MQFFSNFIKNVVLKTFFSTLNLSTVWNYHLLYDNFYGAEKKLQFGVFLNVSLCDCFALYLCEKKEIGAFRMRTMWKSFSKNYRFLSPRITIRRFIIANEKKYIFAITKLFFARLVYSYIKMQSKYFFLFVHLS